MLKRFLAILLLGACSPQSDGDPGKDAIQIAMPAADPAGPASSSPDPVKSGDGPPADFEDASGDLDWLDLLRPNHRTALEQLRPTWAQALAEAREDGHQDEMSFYGAIIDPAVVMPVLQVPRPATYVCRILLLGARFGGLSFLGYPAFECEVRTTPEGRLHFVKTTGSQRFGGVLHPLSDRQMLFVGGRVAEGSGKEIYRYGADVERDYFGVLEQAGHDHWRIVMPRPERAHRVEIVEFWALPSI